MPLAPDAAARLPQLLVTLAQVARLHELETDVPAVLEQLANVVPLRVAVVVLARRDPLASPHTFGWRSEGVDTQELERATLRARAACADPDRASTRSHAGLSLLPLVDGAGRAFGALGVCPFDAHELGADERALVRTVADQLAVAIDRRTSAADSADLLAAASHDLANLLGVVLLGAAQIPPDHPLVAGIHASTRRMGMALGDLDDVASLGRGALARRPAPLSIAALVTDAVARFGQSNTTATSAIHCELPSAPLDADVDRELGLRIVELVLERATKLAGTLPLVVRAGRRRGLAVISMRSLHDTRADEGIDALVGRPRRGGGRTRRPDLGLMMADTFARAYGGRVWAARGPIEGALFIALPLSLAAH